MIEFSKQQNPIIGDVKVQGDKEISYLSIILSSLALGKSKISGLLESENTLNLIEIMKGFNINIEKDSNGDWIVDGRGINGLSEPINVLDVKNSDEILYLLVGLISSYNFKVFFKGDDKLSQLDLKHIFNIFKSIGVTFNGRNDKNLPFLMIGNNDKKQLKYEIDDYDFLLKKVLLLSFLNVQKDNVISEKEKSQDHIELLMKYFGILFEEHDLGNRGNLSVKIGKEITLKGGQNFSAKEVIVPSDISFSAFISALVVLIPGSNVILKNVLMNQHRDAFYRTLIDMGADVTFTNQRIVCGEKVADINVKYSKLRDTVIPGNRIYKMMYEYPILMFIASISNSLIEIQGIKTIKANDLGNYEYIISILKELGVDFTEDKDSLKIKGNISNFDKKIVIDNDKISTNVRLMVAMFGLFLNEPVELNKKIEADFPNLGQFLNIIGFNVKEI